MPHANHTYLIEDKPSVLKGSEIFLVIIDIA